MNEEVFNSPKVKVGDIYQHYKNKNFYKVLCLVKDSETLQDVVVYEAQYQNPISKLWARPYSEWSAEVELDGVKQPRFKLVENKTE
jgi:hypothetical protein